MSPRAWVLSLLTLCLFSPKLVYAESESSECDSRNLLAGKHPSALNDTRGDVDVVTDGRRPDEGTAWNGAGALLLAQPTASLTYDLGQVRRVTTLLAQADANDVYDVSASLDGMNFEPLAALPNVVQNGHGLRTRSREFPERKLRFLRFTPSTGDGFYSLSELSLYCVPPQPFPPPIGSAAVSGAATPAAIGGPSATQQLLPFALLLLCAAGLVLTRRKVRAASPLPDASGARATEVLLHALFVCSGAAALIYEIVWFHLLRLVIGASALSVGLVLASFMGGMFLGSLSFARFVPKSRDPLRVYGLLELGIGCFGMIMPWLLPWVRSLYIGMVGHGAASIALRGLVAGCLLLPPTALMGATLPAIARRYGNAPSAGVSLASLYTANTLGAVLGCVLTGFWLLAVGNVTVATGVAVALNVSIAAAALWRARRPAAVSGGQALDPAARSSERPAPTRAVYLASALSGLSALGAQVVWTRLLTLLFGATVYAFSIILAVFLAGLGLGGAAATRWLRRGGDPVRGLMLCQLGLIATLFAAAWLIANVLPYSAPSTLTPSHALHVLDSLRALDVILPSALLWGASFPFALAAVGGSDADAGRAAGRLYAMNTLGAIAGALLTSYVTIPRFGTHASAQLLVVCAALGAAVLVREPLRALSRAKLERALRIALVLACGWLAASQLPPLATQFLAHGRHIWSIDPHDTYPYVSEGAAATVAVHVAPDGFRHFHVSGRVEASNNPDDMRLERLLGHLSALAHHEPRSVLVVGLGAGVTAGALRLHPEVKRIVICEIEPRVTGATREFARENYDILSDPRVELVFDDARHFLATTSERFDVITSDPIHPWVRGNSVLFSRQYYAIVLEHLRPGGIATQWVPLYDTSAEAIQIQMRTFSAAFPHASVWNSSFTHGGYDVVLLGSPTPLTLSLPEIQARIDKNPELARSLREVSLGSANDLLATYAVSGGDMSSWTRAAPINDDMSLRLEYSSGLALNQQHADEIYRAMIANASLPTQLFTGAPNDVSALLAKIADARRR